MESVLPVRGSRSFRPNYVVIPAVAILVSVLGSWFTDMGMAWYNSLVLPAITPPGWVIGAVWTVLYVLATIAALLVWNKQLSPPSRIVIGTSFALNAIINVSWPLVFFANQHMMLGFLDAALLALSVAVLITIIYPFSKIAAWLLTPYLAWVCFATYLSFSIWKLNS
jgi:translocator protein